MPDQNLFHRQTALVGTNAACLHQALRLLEDLDDAAYSRIGAQIRHTVEFYECFLDGVALLHIDYDSRRRDPMLQRERRVAIARIRTLIERMTMEPELRGDGAVFVRMEDVPSSGGAADPYLMSSVGRELQALISHTIHHFAIIAITLQSIGLDVEEDFGVAPSTLRFRQRTAGPRLLAAAA